MDITKEEVLKEIDALTKEKENRSQMKEVLNIFPEQLTVRPLGPVLNKLLKVLDPAKEFPKEDKKKTASNLGTAYVKGIVYGIFITLVWLKKIQ